MIEEKRSSKWRYESIGECCTIVSGATPRRNVSANWGGDIPWVTPKDISSLKTPILNDAPEYISKVGYNSCSATILPKGAILFSSRAPIGLVAITGREMCTNQGFKSLVPGKNVSSNYLYYCMKWMAPIIAAMGNGATFKEVSKEVVSRVNIPLPPIEDQKRIAAILDKADAIRRKREKAIELADEFLRSVFLDMFGDIPARKSRYTFKHIRPYVKARSGKSSKNVISVKRTEIPIWGGNGVNGWALEPLYHEPVIVVGRVGQRCGITYLTEGPSWVTDNAIVIEIKNLNCLHPVYLEAAFRNSPIREQVKHLDLPFVNQSMLLDYPIPIPPLSEQKKYAMIKKTVLCMQKMQKKYISKANRLFSALSQQAFRGDL